MSKHTPGPWTWNEDFEGLRGASNADVLNYADYEGMWLSDYKGCRQANARLIAAAPDLLIELRQAVIQMEMAAECIENRRYDEALLHVSSLMRSKRAAITKATGE